VRTFISPRLQKPLWSGIAGLAFAAAWLVRGGPLWWVSIVAVIATAVRVISVYRMAGKDTDEGALAGSRADERQKMISLRSRAFSWNLAMAAAFIGLTISVAVKGSWWWPFLVILAVGVFGYLLGLSNYGVAEEGPADDGTGDDADNGQRMRSPAGW
jgi:membrane protein implicated in regulation of membrane protease activity